MRTFYIFKINQEYSKLTKNIPYNLYVTLLSIKLTNNENLDYLKNQYDILTDRLDHINEYIYDKMSVLESYMVRGSTHLYNNYYSDEASSLNVYRSFMILKTNVPNSSFLTMLYQLPHLFIIDFQNQDYFWLNEIGNLRLVNV